MEVVLHIGVVHTSLECPLVAASTFLLLNLTPDTVVLFCTHHVVVNRMDQVTTVVCNNRFTRSRIDHRTDQECTLITRILRIKLLHVIRICGDTIPSTLCEAQSDRILVVQGTVVQVVTTD